MFTHHFKSKFSVFMDLHLQQHLSLRKDLLQHKELLTGQQMTWTIKINIYQKIIRQESNPFI